MSLCNCEVGTFMVGQIQTIQAIKGKEFFNQVKI